MRPNGRVNSDDQIFLISKNSLQIMNIFNQNRGFCDIVRGFVYDKEQKMVIVCADKILVWQLETLALNLTFPEDLSESVFYKVSGSSLFFLRLKQRHIYLLKSNNFHILQELLLPESVSDFEFVHDRLVALVREHNHKFHLVLSQFGELASKLASFSQVSVFYSSSSAFSLADASVISEDAKTVFVSLILSTNSGNLVILQIRVLKDRIELVNESKVDYSESTINTKENSIQFDYVMKKNDLVDLDVIKGSGNTPKSSRRSTQLPFLSKTTLSKFKMNLSHSQDPMDKKGFFDSVCQLAPENLVFFCRTCSKPKSSGYFLQLCSVSSLELRSEIKVDLQTSDFLDISDKFRIKAVSLKKANLKNLYIFGSLGIYLFQFDTETNTFSFVSKKNVKLNNKIDVHHYREQKMIYFAQSNQIEIWAEDLSIRVFSKTFAKPVIQLHFSRSPPTLYIYDTSSYHEFDLLLLSIIRTESCLVESKKNFIHKVNVKGLSANQPIALPYFGKASWQFEEISNMESLSLKHFSFYGLEQSFSTDKYREHIKAFHQYFFFQMQTVTKSGDK